MITLFNLKSGFSPSVGGLTLHNKFPKEHKEPSSVYQIDIIVAHSNI